MSLPPRHPNDLSELRKARSKRKVVAGIAPHTPNRKCIGQIVYDNTAGSGQRVNYLHVTKGHRSRRIVEPSFQRIMQTISQAQR